MILKKVSRLCFGVILVLFAYTQSAWAHPADITVTDFFVERDENNVELADNQLHAVHSINWLEAIEAFDIETNRNDLSQYEIPIREYLDENLSVLNGGQKCAIENVFIPEQLEVELLAIGFFFDFDIVCSEPLSEVSVTASFLLEKYPEQSNFITFYRFPGDLIVTDSINTEKTVITHTVADPQVDQSALSLFVTFIYEGIRHIVPLGLDHILFIATVFLIAGTLRRIVLYSLLFTLAHSITLALTVLGVIVPNGRLTEAIIALSIVVFAIDAIYRFIPRIWQGTIIFVFGLFHGMGFASVLTDLGLPSGSEVLALLGFNIGVEIGQLGVIFALAIGTWWLFKDEARKRLTTVTIATAIAVVATYWLIERLFF